MPNQRYSFNVVLKSTAAISGLTLMTPDEIYKRVWQPEHNMVELDCVDQMDKPVKVSFKSDIVDALMVMEADMRQMQAQVPQRPGPGRLVT